MIDSLVGNDYSLCLCSGLHSQGINVQLVVPENKIIEENEDLIIKKWLPSKEKNSSRLFKLLMYLKYLYKILLIVIVKRNIVLRYQFFRFRFEPLFLLLLRLLRVCIALTAHNMLPYEKSKFDYRRWKWQLENIVMGYLQLYSKMVFSMLK